MLARELDVAGQVVDGGVIHAANTAGSTAHHEASAHNQLHLAEGTAGGDQGLAHVLEDGVTRGGHVGGGDGALGVHVGGQSGSLIGASVGIERGTAIGYIDVVSSVGRDLLSVRCQRGHLRLYPCRRK